MLKAVFCSVIEGNGYLSVDKVFFFSLEIEKITDNRFVIKIARYLLVWLLDIDLRGRVCTYFEPSVSIHCAHHLTLPLIYNHHHVTNPL